MNTNSKFHLSILLGTQFLERLAYTNILIQLPIYLAQKGFENTLAWEQEVKGWIFFIWALVQNLTPVLFGTIADKISASRGILFSLFIVTLGYYLLSSSTSFELILISLILVGLGSGFFKPSMQSLLSKSRERKIWAIYIFISNCAFLIALIISKFFRTLGWEYVFVGSFIISLANLVVTFFVIANKNESKKIVERKEKIKIAEILNVIKEKRMFLLICITTCFAMIYMQFYETLPNFIVDWVDTSSIVKKIPIPDDFTMNTIQGKQISYEVLYILNPLTILLFVGLLHKFTEKRNITNALIAAQIFVSTGFTLCGFTRIGTIFIIGTFVYTIGETLFNMKILEIITKIAPEHKRATYFGVLNISYTIGLTIGALSGGYLYKEFSEKFSLAKRFIAKHFQNTTFEEPFAKISEILHIEDVTSFLWSYYKPYYFWIPFLIFGMLGVVLAFVYKKYKLD